MLYIEQQWLRVHVCIMALQFSALGFFLVYILLCSNCTTFFSFRSHLSAKEVIYNSWNSIYTVCLVFFLYTVTSVVL